eukprot:2430060-Rhodomonas_salina.1
MMLSAVLPTRPNYSRGYLLTKLLHNLLVSTREELTCLACFPQSFTFASDFEECPALAESFAVLFAPPPPPPSASFQSERQRARSDEAKEEEEELEAVVSAFRPTLP